MKDFKSFEMLYSAERIQTLCRRMGEEITQAYPKDQPLLCVGVLKGAFMFMSDLIRFIDRPVQVDFIRATSYGVGTQSTGTVRILKDIEADLSGKHVLLIDEMIDTGRTLAFIKSRLKNSEALSVRLACLLDKHEKRVVDCEADFVGERCADHFVVGYGLDWAENYRELPAIYKVPSTSV